MYLQDWERTHVGGRHRPSSAMKRAARPFVVGWLLIVLFCYNRRSVAYHPHTVAYHPHATRVAPAYHRPAWRWRLCRWRRGPPLCWLGPRLYCGLDHLGPRLYWLGPRLDHLRSLLMRAIFTGCDCPTVCNSTYSQIQSGTTRAGGPLLPIAPRPRRTVTVIAGLGLSPIQVAPRFCVFSTRWYSSSAKFLFVFFWQSDGRLVWQPRPIWMTLAGVP